MFYLDLSFIYAFDKYLLSTFYTPSAHLDKKLANYGLGVKSSPLPVS